ncbi:MAG: SRPBCC family protein [Nitrospiraceae bacterium]|nr:MAG: SRPBCC family protein [Nitrospiraceae bacterium]
MIKLTHRSVHVSREYRVPCQRLWEVITDASRWPEWGPSVTAVECPDRMIRKGSRGRVKTALGIWVGFAITDYEEGRSWSWNVLGVPATGHRVEPAGEGSCRLVFEVPLLAAAYAVVCKAALDRIARILESKGTPQ